MPALYDVIRRHPDEVDKRWKIEDYYLMMPTACLFFSVMSLCERLADLRLRKDVSSHVPGAKTIGQAVDKFLNSLREMASPVTF